ncbi:hypothetical protein [Paenibacillus sp. LHD-38]|uniref:hypothetical protein n=1 Tax=Paenibacillus sp. LHD-38 TaxID=3072143 RepID=UPI00280DF91C|nr:hypothetical protein [Paenibacillus sp. LHD-38]MDQ8738562.1 hypothetical protein [Paenibacillus sp. LHD-38]
MKSWSWERETENYAMLVRSRLAGFGIDYLEQADVTITYTPEQLERDMSAIAVLFTAYHQMELG